MAADNRYIVYGIGVKTACNVYGARQTNLDETLQRGRCHQPLQFATVRQDVPTYIGTPKRTPRR
eukprot:8034366-Lingulodinium_polyedra.AAC.1